MVVLFSAVVLAIAAYFAILRLIEFVVNPPTLVIPPTTTVTTSTTVTPTYPAIEAKAYASLGIDDRGWDICQTYPINVTIEFKWRTHEWRAAGFKPGEQGELMIDVEIRLVREPFSPIIKNGRFFVEISNYRSANVEMGPLLNLSGQSFEPKEVGEHIVNKVSFDFDFHPKEEEVELTGVDYGLEYEIEIRGEIDGRPVEIEVSYSLFPWPISIWP